MQSEAEVPDVLLCLVLDRSSHAALPVRPALLSPTRLSWKSHTQDGGLVHKLGDLTTGPQHLTKLLDMAAHMPGTLVMQSRRWGH